MMTPPVATPNPRARRAVIAGMALFAVVTSCQAPRGGSADAPSAFDERATLPLDRIEPRVALPDSPPQSAPPPSETSINLLRSAQSRFDSDLWSDAMAEVRSALRDSPGYLDAHILAARIAVRQGGRALAESHLDEATRVAPRDARIHDLRGRLAWEAGDATGAIQHFRLALLAAAASGDSAAYGAAHRALTQLYLGLALAKEDYLVAARDALESYLAAADDASLVRNHRELSEAHVVFADRVGVCLGDVHERLGDHARAATFFERAAAARPDDARLKTRWARAVARSGDRGKALELMRRVAGDCPPEDAVRLVEEVCALVGEPQRSKDELTALSRKPGFASIAVGLADRALAEGDANQAVTMLKRAIADDAENVALRYRLADACRLAGRRVECLRELIEAMGRAPRTWRRGLNSAAALAESSGGVEQVISDLRGMDESVGRGPRAALLAGLLVAASRDDEAIAAIDAALDGAVGQSDVAGVWIGALNEQLARLHRRAHRWPEAIESCRAAIRRDYRESSVHMLLADALEAQDDPDDAEAAYREAARLSPEDPEPLLALADMHDRAGRANQARQIWRSILTDVDSRNAAAHEALVRSYITARMVPQAQQQLAQIESLKLSGPPIERSRSLLTLYLSSDDPRTRLTHYRKVLTDLLAESPDDGMSQLHLAFSFAMERRYDDALRALNTLLQRQPEHMQGRELRVDLLRNLLRQDEAAAVLDDMIAERPRYARWREMALQVALDRVDIDRALAELDGLIARPDLQDRHVIWRNQKVQLLLSIGRADQGVALARALHEEKPDDPLRRDAFLGALSWAGRKDEAVTEALRLHEANPTRLDLRAALISKLITAGRTTEATQRVLAWMEDEPQADLLMRLLISALYESRQYDEVIALAHSTRIDTDLGLDSYRTLLNSYVRTGRVRDAESLIEQFTAPERGLQSVDANAELADVYYQSGRLAEARRMIERIIAPELTAMRAGEAVDLTLTGLWIQQLANIMDRLGDDAEGEALLEELYHATPESAGINNDLGYLWADAGKNLAQAEKMIRLAVSLNPRQSAYLDSLGWARYKRGAFDDAVEWIRRAVYWSDWQARQRDEPVDPVLADHYGDALYRAGRRDDARAWWTRSIEALIDPRYRVLDAERDGALKIATQAKIAALDGGGDPEVATAATDGG